MHFHVQAYASLWSPSKVNYCKKQGAFFTNCQPISASYSFGLPGECFLLPAEGKGLLCGRHN